MKKNRLLLNQQYFRKFSIKNETGQKNLCLAGGVALNCVVNGKIVEEGIFDNVWIQPASGDAVAIQGSSNFTASGLGYTESDQYEMNMLLKEFGQREEMELRFQCPWFIKKE